MRYLHSTIKFVIRDSHFDLYYLYSSTSGTEKNINDVYSIEDTANIETWYRPDIKSDCQIKLADTGAVYEVMNEPENIDMRNQYCKFKVRRVKGGA